MSITPNFELLGFYAGVLSLCLGTIFFFASLFFYDKSKKSENENIKILSDIKSATNVLNSLTNKMLDKAIGHIAASNEQLVTALATHTVPIAPETINSHNSYTLLAYSYIVKTNFLAKACYAKVTCDKTKSSLQKIIDTSKSDHEIVCIGINKIDELKLKNSPLFEMYISDKNFYGEMINLEITKSNK